MIAIRSISRFRAATVHLAASAAVAVAVLGVMLALWYPPPLFKAMGGTELVVLIIGIDVAIGPLITLIIFDTRKKELVFDLAMIAVLQLGALGYGIYAMHAGRPVFTVFTERRLAVVSAADIDPDELAKTHVDDFRRLSLTGPRLVAADSPTDPRELSELALAGLVGFGIQQLPKYYVPYVERRTQVLSVARPLVELVLTPEGQGVLQACLKRTGKKADELRFLPVTAKHGILLGMVDAATGNLLEILEIDPTRK